MRTNISLAALAALSLAGCGGTSLNISRVVGESRAFGAGKVETWAMIDSSGEISEVGATIPMTLVRNLATTPPGDGPLGAVASLKYPEMVRQKTFFNTLALHANPNGHPGAYYTTPHFDVHFYNVPDATIRTYGPVDAASQASSVVLPAGYVMEPGAVPQMGTHAITAEDATALNGERKFIKTMIQGYFNGKVIFVEPMVTQELMLSKESFTLPVPKPTKFGLAAPTLYPTKFSADYNATTDSYDFHYTEFVTVQ